MFLIINSINLIFCILLYFLKYHIIYYPNDINDMCNNLISVYEICDIRFFIFLYILCFIYKLYIYLKFDIKFSIVTLLFFLIDKIETSHMKEGWNNLRNSIHFYISLFIMIFSWIFFFSITFLVFKIIYIEYYVVDKCYIPFSLFNDVYLIKFCNSEFKLEYLKAISRINTPVLTKNEVNMLANLISNDKYNIYHIKQLCDSSQSNISYSINLNKDNSWGTWFYKNRYLILSLSTLIVGSWDYYFNSSLIWNSRTVQWYYEKVGLVWFQHTLLQKHEEIIQGTKDSLTPKPSNTEYFNDKIRKFRKK